MRKVCLYEGLAGIVVVEAVLPRRVVQLPALNSLPMASAYLACLICLMYYSGNPTLVFVVIEVLEKMRSPSCSLTPPLLPNFFFADLEIDCAVLNR